MSHAARKVFISAGELSGEMLAVALVRQMKKLDPSLQFYGVAGDLLKAEGVVSLVHSKDLSVIGFAEVLGLLPRIVRIEEEIFRCLDLIKPDIAILVDYPGFHFRLAPSLKARKIKVVQYVAPKVWAWGQHRVAKLRNHFDLVLGVLPFEAEFFSSHSVPYRYVGSPHIDRVNAIQPCQSALEFKTESSLIALLPGSRNGEIKRILNPLLQIAEKLTAMDNKLRFVIPVAAGLDFEEILKKIGDYFGTPIAQKGDFADIANIRVIRGKSLEIMKSADFAVVTSGTATLECALLETPLVVIYRASFLSYQIGIRLLKVNWIGLVNLCAGKELAKEFVQNLDPSEISRYIFSIVSDSSLLSQKRQELTALRKNFSGQAETQASKEILKLLEAK
jgi:lipid-A-disaccharide synthase